jgi:hypothetical protein
MGVVMGKSGTESVELFGVALRKGDTGANSEIGRNFVQVDAR